MPPPVPLLLLHHRGARSLLTDAQRLGFRVHRSIGHSALPRSPRCTLARAASAPRAERAPADAGPACAFILRRSPLLFLSLNGPAARPERRLSVQRAHGAAPRAHPASSPPLLVAGTPGWMLRPALRCALGVRGGEPVAHGAARCFADLQRRAHRVAPAAAVQPRDGEPRVHIVAASLLHGGGDDHVVAAHQPDAGAAAALVSEPDAVPASPWRCQCRRRDVHRATRTRRSIPRTPARRGSGGSRRWRTSDRRR